MLYSHLHSKIIISPLSKKMNSSKSISKDFGSILWTGGKKDPSEIIESLIQFPKIKLLSPWDFLERQSLGEKTTFIVLISALRDVR
ncbi:hypothetical protein HI914_07235 [Erysiphe necator]|nr:hypothetical protein HI914_07235 [Erysiphe necator]